MSSTEQTPKWKLNFCHFRYSSSYHHDVLYVQLLIIWSEVFYFYWHETWRFTAEPCSSLDAGVWAETIDCGSTARSVLCRLWFHMHKRAAPIPRIFWFNLCALEGSFASLFTFFHLLITCLCALQFLWTLQYGCDG